MGHHKRKPPAQEPPQRSPWEVRLALALLMAAAALHFAGTLDIRSNDIWWHLAAGREMLSQGRVPRADPFTHTMGGRPWTDFEWLFQAAAYLTVKASGIRGLILAKAALLSLQTGLLGWLLLGAGPLRLAPMLMTAFWVYALTFRDYVRPEIVTYLLMTVLWLLLEREGWDRRRTWVCAGLFCLWANVHAGFAMGLALLGAHAVRSRFLRWALAACSLAVLFNPYGWKVYAVLFEHMRLMAAHRGEPWQVMEWGATPFQGNLAFWGYAALSLLAALAAQIRAKRLDLAGSIVLVLFLVPAVRYSRNTQLFVLASLPVFMRHVSWLLEGAAFSLPVRRASWAALLLGLVGACAWGVRLRSQSVVVERKDYPIRAVAFLLQERPEGNLYNTYSWGGYLDWALYPHMRPMADSRYLFTDALKEDYLARRSTAAWNAYLDRNGIRAALVGYPVEFSAVPRRELKPGVLEAPPRSDLVRLFPPSRWALVFWDSTSLVFIRRGAGNDALIQTQEYRNFRPDDYLYADSLMRQGRVRMEDLMADLRRNLETLGKHPAALFFLDFFTR